MLNNTRYVCGENQVRHLTSNEKSLLIRRYAITNTWEREREEKEREREREKREREKREREERVMLTVNLSVTDHYRTKLLITELSLRDVAKPLMIEGMNE